MIDYAVATDKMSDKFLAMEIDEEKEDKEQKEGRRE